MAGIYLHIPFCKQKCSYCDFHFSTSFNNTKKLIQAMLKEIELKNKWINDTISTIYFGGGTPSSIDIEYLDILTNELYRNYTISNQIEFTIECNPDDISKKKLSDFKQIGINRLSIGIQSFMDEDLQFFNRAHNGNEAEKSVKKSQDSGFQNITVDLIYGFPLLTQKKWENNLQKIKELNIPHLSAYSLTIEPKTALNHWVKTKKVIPMNDKTTISQFNTLIDFTSKIGLNQYEISNYAKEGFESKHNSSYWNGKSYIGIGPSAHSFIQKSEEKLGLRAWNISNNNIYIKNLEKNLLYFEQETINKTTEYNEFVLTRLRTMKGISLHEFEKIFDVKYKTHLTKEAKKYIQNGELSLNENSIILTKKGIFIADKIISDLMYID